MKIKVSKIIESVEALKSLSLQKFPIGTLFKLRKNYTELEGAIKLFEEKRKEIFEKHGTPQDGSMTIPKENEGAYFADMEKLIDEEIDIELSQIDLPASYEMTLADLAKIDYVINIPE